MIPLRYYATSFSRLQALFHRILRKPLAYAVSGGDLLKKVFLGWTKLSFTNYTEALKSLGAAVERSAPEPCDALLLPGGGDISPCFYGQETNEAMDIDEARDTYEFSLFRHFFSAGKPILGICRGAQVINVALGGTLFQHIAGHSQIDGVDSIHFVHASDTALRALYGDRFPVNSAHHQAVDRPGRELHVSARAEDGTIEALHHETLPVFAVQWHPERLGEAGAELLRAFLNVI